jgi:hypothetical protein
MQLRLIFLTVAAAVLPVIALGIFVGAPAVVFAVVLLTLPIPIGLGLWLGKRYVEANQRGPE